MWQLPTRAAKAAFKSLTKIQRVWEQPSFKQSVWKRPYSSRTENPIWGSKKFTQRQRETKVLTGITGKMEPEVESLLQPLRDHVKIQGDLVRELKGKGADAAEVKRAVAELKARKKKLEDKELEMRPSEESFDRAKMEDLLKRRFFYDQSFSIYNGVSGQYDFGPMGCAIKSNILNLWRSFFVLEEQMLEVDCTILTPEYVLKASGHVDKFADLMVKDLLKGDCYRLDHLIKESLEKVMNDKKTTAETKTRCTELVTQLDNFGAPEMSAIMKEFSIKAPLTGNDLSEPMEFNLMFQTHIGPTGREKGFLRPETAQGIFVNFKRLLEFNQGRLPFAAAQIGNAFRNEISPRAGLLRVREFTMAEIEHFCDPADKSHPKFASMRDTKLVLFSACNQMDGKPAILSTVGEAVDGVPSDHFQSLLTRADLRCLDNHLAHHAYIGGFVPTQKDAAVLAALEDRFWKGEFRCLPNVARWLKHANSFTGKEVEAWPGEKGVAVGEISKELFGCEERTKGSIANETLGYFMARIQLFLSRIGVDQKRIRFRQHMSNEMAHYACDCWDAELLTSYGWVECVGCADRSAFDLTCHQKATNVKLCAEKKLPEPISVEVVELVMNKGLFGKHFKADAKAVTEAINSLDTEEVNAAEKALEADGKFSVSTGGKSFDIPKDMVAKVKRSTKKVHVEEIVPSVIEPSFGIGRIMYALLEHNFKIREGDDARRYFTLPPVIAPLKCSVLPLSNNAEFTPLIRELSKALTEAEVSHKVDDSSGSIGRRYSRTDEIAVPFGICVDFDSLKEPNTATLRERDTTLQVRMPMSEIPSVVRQLSVGKMTWEAVMAQYPKFEQQESTTK